MNWQRVLELAGIKEFLGHENVFDLVGEELCSDGAPTQKICSALLSAFVGVDPAGFNNVRSNYDFFQPFYIGISLTSYIFSLLDHIPGSFKPYPGWNIDSKYGAFRSRCCYR